ncbi:MAG: hypothetical protein R2860_01345 [Desulfobacterales bacterium]
MKQLYSMDKLENYQIPAHPAWLDALIKGRTGYLSGQRVFHSLYSSYEPRYSENRPLQAGTVYEQGHIP